MLALDIALSILESVTYTYFLSRLLNQRKINYLVFIAFTAFIVVSNTWLSYVFDDLYKSVFGMLLVIGVCLSFMKFILRVSYKQLVLPYIMYMISSLLANLISYLILNVAKLEGYTFTSVGTLMSMLACLVVSFLFNKQLQSFLNSLYLMRSVNKKVIQKQLSIFLAVLTLGLLFTWSHFNMHLQGELAMYASAFLVCITWYLSVNLKENLTDSLRIHELEQQQLYTNAYSNVVEKLKHFSHNYGNVIQSLAFCVNDESITREELLDILNETLAWDKMYDAKNAMKLMEIKHPVLSGVVASKISYAESLDVVLEYTVEGSGGIGANAGDVIEVLSVLLDNAIEVAAYTESKKVYLSMEHIGEQVKLIVENEKHVDVEGETMKFGATNGIGLRTVKAKLEKYANTYCNVTDTESLYKTEILL